MPRTQWTDLGKRAQLLGLALTLGWSGGVARAESPASRGRSAGEPRFELTAFVGQSRSAVVVEGGGGHDRMGLEEIDARYRAESLELAGRILWNQRLSTILSAGNTNQAEHQESFPRPASPPFPGSTYLAERTTGRRTSYLSLLEAWELRPRARLQLYLAGGVELRRSSDRQEGVAVDFTTGEVTARPQADWIWTRTVVVAAVGLRAPIGRHGVVTAEALLRALGASEAKGESAWRARVGLGARF